MTRMASPNPGRTASSAGRGEEESVARGLEHHATTRGDHLAVCSGDTRLTYGELNAVSNRIANTLLSRLGAEPQQIAVLLPHGAAAIGAMLGVLKSAKAFVYIDPEHPDARCRELLRDSRTSLVVADAAAAERVRGLGLDLPAIDAAVDGDAGDPGLRSDPEALAGIIYTSGSTGRPKGVMRSHAQLLAQARVYRDELDLSPQDRVSLLAPLGTGGGTSLTFGALLNGASLLAYDVRRLGVSGLLRWMGEQRVTILWTTPLLFRELPDASDTPSDLSSLRVVRLGGDRLTRRDVERFRAQMPRSCSLVNVLGASETGTLALYRFDGDEDLDAEALPVGYPTADVKIRIVDDRGQDLGPGAVGEIAIRSPFLTPGYWSGGPASSAFREMEDGTREWRSGDLGRFADDGCLFCLGRADSRVKIRGHRVEIEEVERALGMHPKVASCAVGVRRGPMDEDRLVAWVVPSRKGLRPRNLSWHLRQRLPDYMVPADYAVVDELPVNDTGRLDEELLWPPATLPKARRAGDSREPAGCITAIWSELLGQDPIGPDDDLYLDHGADSFTTVRAAREIARRLGYDIVPEHLRAAPTIAAQVALVEGAPVPDQEMIPLRRSGSKTPLVLLPPATGLGAFAYVDLARALDDRPVVALQDPHFFVPGGSFTSLTETAAYYLAELDRSDYQPPYILGGASQGGRLAFEMARLISLRGDPAPPVVMFDCITPPRTRMKAAFLFGFYQAITITYRLAPRIAMRLYARRGGTRRSLARLAGIHYSGRFFFSPRVQRALFPKLSKDAIASGEGLEKVIDRLSQRLGLYASTTDLEMDLHRTRILIKNLELADRHATTWRHPGKMAVFSVRGRHSGQRWRPFCTGEITVKELVVARVNGRSRHGSFLKGKNLSRHAHTIEACLERLSETR